MNTTGRRGEVAALLIGLPLLSNVASFAIFAPLFATGQVTSANFQRAGNLLAIALILIECAGLGLVVWLLHREGSSLREVINW